MRLNQAAIDCKESREQRLIAYAGVRSNLFSLSPQDTTANSDCTIKDLKQRDEGKDASYR
jgi:hypothetical protein